MYCKYCGSELPKGQTLCVSCGKETEDHPKKAARNGKNPLPKRQIIIVTAIVLAAALIIGLIIFGLTGGFTPKKNDVYIKGDYSALAFWADLKADDVVATMGEYTLTNRELQIYYWMQVYDFLSSYGSYASYLGLDCTKPLEGQIMDKGTGMTWEQYFLDGALSAWQRYTILGDMAAKAGYQLPEVHQKSLDELRANMEKMAEEEKISSVDELLQKEMGPGANFEMYKRYLETYYSSLYLGEIYENMTATQLEIQEYFVDNGASFSLDNGAFTVKKDTGYLVDVRHILIVPEGGTKGEDGKTTVYTEEAWEAARVKAQEIYDAWLAGDKTEESFADSAAENSADGSKSEGGLYTYVYKGEMVKEFEDWCFAEGRKSGDHGLVKTVYGYHIMYYVCGDEGWIRLSDEGVRWEKTDALLEQTMKDTPLNVTYKAIVLPDHTLENIT